MNAYRFSDLFAPQSYPSFYSPHYIRFVLLLQGYGFLNQKMRVLEVSSEESLHQVTLEDYMHVSLDEFLRFDSGQENSFDGVIINTDWARLPYEQRALMKNQIHRVLKQQGVVSIRYSSMPGCAPLMALRDFMLIQMNPDAFGEERKMQGLQALYLTDNYAKTDSAFFLRVPKARDCLEDIKRTPFDQLEKDWLDPFWNPIFSSDLMEDLEHKNYTFVTSLNLPLQLEMCLPPEVAPLLQQESDPIFRETIRDFGLNQLMRIDLFTKGTSVSIDNVEEVLSRMPFCLTAPKPLLFPIKIPAPGGDLLFDDAIYETFLEAFAAEDYRPKTIHDLKEKEALQGLDSDLFLAVLTILVASGVLYPTSLENSDAIFQRCVRYNMTIAEDFSKSSVLASPVLGTGIPCSRMWTSFLLAYTQGAQTKDDYAQKVFELFKAHQELFRDSSGTVMDDQQALNFLKEQAQTFITVYVPYFTAIKVLPLRKG